LVDLKLVPNESVLFQCVAGSHAYGLASEESDIDHRGVFIAEKDSFLRGDFPEDVSNETNDDVLYEVGKFIRLLAKSNPTVIELIAMPPDSIQKGSDWMASIDHSKVLSKQCKDSFAGYALSQIRKARKIKGLINFPNEDNPKTALDFLDLLGSVGIETFAEWRTLHPDRNPGFVKEGNFVQIVELSNAQDLSDEEGELIFQDSKGLPILVWASLRETEWKAYLKSYRAYWKWQHLVKEGSPVLADYNTKNMMHAFRLVYMGIELARTGKLNVRRTNDREFLMNIRKLQFTYEELVIKLEKSLLEMNQAFAKSSLREFPDENYLSDFLRDKRKWCYSLE
jgi:uncharacterized protein